MAVNSLGHSTVKVNDPSVKGLNLRCTVCGGCDCHTGYLMKVTCDEVTKGAYRIYMHSEQREPADVLHLRRQGSETFDIEGQFVPPIDIHDDISIRKVALECSVRMAHPNHTRADILDRADEFAEWIKTGKSERW